MEEAERLRVQHLQDHPNYKYRPRRKKTTKKLKRVETGLLLHSLAQGGASGLGLGLDNVSAGSAYGHPGGHPTHHHHPQHLLPSLGHFRDLQAPGHLEMESYGLPTPEMSPLDVLENGGGESVFFPQHMQEEAGMGGWSGYHYHLHHDQHYSHHYNQHGHHNSLTHSQGSGMSSRMESRMSPSDAHMAPSMSSSSGLTSLVDCRLDHHISLRSAVKGLDSCSSPSSYPQPPISLSEPIKSHQTPLGGSYYNHLYGGGATQSHFTASHLGQLSPPPETSPSSSCSASSVPPSAHLDPSNPGSSPAHLGSSSEFWSEVDRHELDQYVNVGRTRGEAYGLGGGCEGASKVLGGRGSNSSGILSSIMSGSEEGSSALISALSDASSAVYYSACITG